MTRTSFSSVKFATWRQWRLPCRHRSRGISCSRRCIPTMRQATRLVDSGLEPYLVASSLEVVVAQRLVRLSCQKCKEEMPRADVELLRSDFGKLVPEKLYRGRGCRNCQNTGYRGR